MNIGGSTDHYDIIDSNEAFEGAILSDHTLLIKSVCSLFYNGNFRGVFGTSGRK